MKKAVVIGLTGQTGAGKSTVCKIFSNANMFVIDADKVAREVLENEKRCLADIILEFGCLYLTSSGNLDRGKLGSFVFANKDKLKRLNAITFPYILKSIKDKINENLYKQNVIIIDAPTLFESGADEFCDKIVSVIAREELRKYRIIQRDNLSEADAQNRINSQHNDDYYTGKSWIVIDNSEDIGELEAKTYDAINEINNLA
ncbi:MAG: dephospho-CoA kinase [Oscillospiraceae bacterium]